MKFHIIVLSVMMGFCSCAIESRVNRPWKVHSTVTRPGDTVLAVSEPECKFQDNNGQCCLTVSISKENGIENCVKVGTEGNKGFASYIFSGHELARKDLTNGKSCFPIPNTPFKACIHIYYTDVKPEAKEGNVCMYASINKVISLDFNCIRYSGGKFQHNKEHTPESQGIFDVEFANGKENISIGRPLQD